METMRALVRSWLVACVSLCAALPIAAQTPVGALAVDERRGQQYGWAVDYETEAAAWEAALSECGAGCSVVLTFARCGAYAADQDADSTAVGWAESYASADGARQAALSECRSRGGGSGCIVRAWGCNGPVVEEGLGLDRATRRLIQQGLGAEGFDAGVADGLFGPRTRAAIRSWQSSRGIRPTGYLNTRAVEALQDAGASGAAASAAVTSTPSANAPAAPPASGAELEGLFWQSIVNSTNPADFEAYLEQFPNGVFRALARNRLAELSGSAGDSRATGLGAGGVRTTASRPRVSEASGPAPGAVASGDARRRPSAGFRPAQTCASQPAAGCWMEIAHQSNPGCYFWQPWGDTAGATVTWTGVCAGGLAQQAGTLTWAWDGNLQTATGDLRDGQLNGRWSLRRDGAWDGQGHFVDGRENGHFVLRYPDGQVDEGPFADGMRNGHWVEREPNGEVREGPYVDGQRNGNWVIRDPDGQVDEGPYVDGQRNGNWVIRFANGTVAESSYRNGERVR